MQCTAGPHPCSIAEADTNRVTLRWTIRFDRIFGRWPLITTAVVVLTGLGALVAYRWDRRSRERTPGTRTIPAWFPVAASGGQPATRYSPSGLGGFDSAVSSAIRASQFSQDEWCSSGGSSGRVEIASTVVDFEKSRP
ncbi:hypothetical protein ACAG26_10550 [Mycobacterium sp. pUA109]|uniref:hypothetical protein n=1 Tax=Mycobacterium sp. pUA109 TaxID=3238982 RepID=UPI00351BA4B5